MPKMVQSDFIEFVSDQMSNLADILISKEERWNILVNRVMAPWLDSHLAVEDIPMTRGCLCKQSFRDKLSKLVRNDGWFDTRIIKLVFPGEDHAKAPFARSFKQLLNKDHEEWESTLADEIGACAQGTKTTVIDRLCSILRQVPQQAMGESALSRESEVCETASIAEARPASEKNGNVRPLGSNKCSRRTTKLQMIAEQESEPSSARRDMGKWANSKRNPGLKDRLASSSGEFKNPYTQKMGASARVQQITGRPV